MKDDKITVIPQNMREHTISIRDADNENDVFREAFEKAIEEDSFDYDPNDRASVMMYMLLYDFFRYGWEAAVRELNDDEPEEGQVNEALLAYLKTAPK